MMESTDPLDTASPDNSSFPKILLAGDDARAAEFVRQKLSNLGFLVHLAPGYLGVEEVWHAHRQPIILLDVSHVRAVDAAVNTAIAIKRQDPAQFVAYLADPILRTSGLAGDAILPRNPSELPGALHRHFAACR